MDKIGTAATDSPLSPGLLQNTPEELYWRRVPEKFRREAAVKAVRSTGGDSTNDDAEAKKGMGENDEKSV